MHKISNTYSSAHYRDVITDPMASQITSLTIVYSTVYSGADQRKHQSSASLAFVRGIHRWPVNSPQKWPVKRKIFPFDDVIISDMYVQIIYLDNYIICIMQVYIYIISFRLIIISHHHITSQYLVATHILSWNSNQTYDILPEILYEHRVTFGVWHILSSCGMYGRNHSFIDK